MALEQILDEPQRQLLADERGFLAEVRDYLADCDAAGEDLATLDRSIEQLDELFLLVVVGVPCALLLAYAAPRLAGAAANWRMVSMGEDWRFGRGRGGDLEDVMEGEGGEGHGHSFRAGILPALGGFV